MADKRISQLVERTDIANNDVLPIVASGATTTNKVTVSTLQDWMQDNLDVGVTSVGLSVPSAFTVSGSPVTTSGNITISGAGTTAQYIRGDGSLADFPSSLGGGGASVSYYLNGSVNQGTIGGVAYRELSKSPILGAGTDFTINADGYIASFITDAGDPSLLEIPGGNWNFETYFQASSGGGSPTFYVELYKVSSGGTATLIATSSGSPELIAFGTNTTPYFSSLAVPTTTLALTDRLAIRYYVVHAGRTITLHTENNTLCQIITTFTTGLTALNGLTAQVQNFATGTSGTDFNISSASTTHTFNLPDASASNRGAVTTGSQVFGGVKTFANGLSLPSAGGSNQVTRLVNIGTLHEGSATLNQIGFNSANNIYFGKGLSNGGVLQWTNAAVRYYTLPDADGTLALASQLGAYLPLTGGTLTGALGGTSLNFSGDIQTATRLISATGGQQILINANNGGSTNRIESVGTLPLALVSAAAITLAAGGTTPQITLATTGAVTLTGALNGTSAVLSGNAQVSKLLLGTSTANSYRINLVANSDFDTAGILLTDTNTGGRSYAIGSSITTIGSLEFRDNTAGQNRLTISSTGAATFSSSVTTGSWLNVPNTFGLTIRNAANTAFRTAIQMNASNVLIFGQDTDITALTLGVGSEAMRITSAGNVGIGTASPLSTLVVSNGSNENIEFVPGSTTLNGGVIEYINRTSGTTRPDLNIYNGSSNGSIKIFTGGNAERFRINSSGNIGIGTTTPTTYSLAGTHTEIFGGSNFAFLHNNTTSVKSFFAANESGGVAALFTFSNHPLTFGTNNTERMRITSSGNVGIGTASPANILSVRQSNTSTATILELTNTSSGSNTTKASRLLFGLADTVGTVKDAAYIESMPSSGLPNVQSAELVFGTRTGDAAPAERMRITSGGNVGIGVTSPTYKLQVDGNVYFKGATSGTGDFACVIQNSSTNNLFFIRNDGLVTIPSLVSTFTTGSAANMFVSPGDGAIYRSTSSIKYKKNVQDYDKGLTELMQMRPVFYEGISESDEGKIFAGLIAEEVHDLGLTEFVQYAEDGSPDSLAYQNMVALLIKSIQELKAEIDSLKTK
jgi:hypothetical protein